MSLEEEKNTTDKTSSQEVHLYRKNLEELEKKSEKFSFNNQQTESDKFQIVNKIHFKTYLIKRLIRLKKFLIFAIHVRKNLKQYFKENIDADKEFLEKVIKNTQIYKKTKQFIDNNVTIKILIYKISTLRKIIYEIRTSPLKESIYKIRTLIKIIYEIEILSLKIIYEIYEIGALSLKTKIYEIYNFIKTKISEIYNLLIKFFKEVKFKTKAKEFISLYIVKLKSLHSFCIIASKKIYLIKNLNKNQKLKLFKSTRKQIHRKLNERLKILSLHKSLELKKLYIKLKLRLIVFYFKYKVIFKQKGLDYYLKLKTKLNKSKRFQLLITKFNNAKLTILKLCTNFENFIINIHYDYNLAIEYGRLAREYAERILFVIAMYSLPLLLLTKLFYGNILRVSQAGYTRFDSIIPENHLRLITSDTKAVGDYIPLKFIPKILQYTAIDFYIFLSYYTVFGTSKFPLNKEVVYHGILCVAHLIVYASTGLIMGILQNFTEFYMVALNTWVRIFVSTKFRRFFKHKQLKKSLEFFTLKKALTEDPTAPLSEWNHYGICGLDKIVSNIPRSSEIFFTSYLLTPLSLYVLVTLIYNCCYYIRYNKRPFIPVITNLAKRITPNVQKDE